MDRVGQMSRAGVRVVSRPSTSPLPEAVRRSLSGLGEGSPPAGSGGRLPGREERTRRTDRLVPLAAGGKGSRPRHQSNPHAAADWTPPLPLRSADYAIPWSRPTDGAPSLGFGGERTPDSIVSSASSRAGAARQPTSLPTRPIVFCYTTRGNFPPSRKTGSVCSTRVLSTARDSGRILPFSSDWRTSAELGYYDAHSRECKEIRRPVNSGDGSPSDRPRPRPAP